MMAATVGVQKCVELLGLQTSWDIFAKRDALVFKQVMRSVLVRRMPCAAVSVAGERGAVLAFHIAANLIHLARGAAGALAYLRVMPCKRMSQPERCSCRGRVMAQRGTRIASCTF